ncbi:hypothetical protein GQ55_7G346400 [Panicum hallii var. hallii]|uniref:Uncharacterized protein n=1 Tax=Panicum hallii var. hallii TaxID=1504633 RepID=A0A2T7D2B7_9POAL|nr:hypothetical protein GQ55_7G346400 [Panicum hallii var. hallii]
MYMAISSEGLKSNNQSHLMMLKVKLTLVTHGSKETASKFIGGKAPRQQLAIKTYLCFLSHAVLPLQEAAEAKLVALFVDTKLCVIHANHPRAFSWLGGSTQEGLGSLLP